MSTLRITAHSVRFTSETCRNYYVDKQLLWTRVHITYYYPLVILYTITAATDLLEVFNHICGFEDHFTYFSEHTDGFH